MLMTAAPVSPAALPLPLSFCTDAVYNLALDVRPCEPQNGHLVPSEVPASAVQTHVGSSPSVRPPDAFAKANGRFLRNVTQIRIL